MSKNLKEIIAEIQFRYNVTQEEIAQKLGYSRPYLTKVINEGKDGKVLDKIRRAYPEIVPKNTESKIVEPDPSQGQNSYSVIEKLAESNRLIAESNNNGSIGLKIIADANKVLVESNAALTSTVNKMVVDPTADFPLNIPPALMMKLKAILVEISKSAPAWKTQQEALIGIDKIFYADLDKAQKNDKKAHSDRIHN